VSLSENDTLFLFTDGRTASRLGNPFAPLVPVSSDVTAPSFVVPSVKTYIEILIWSDAVMYINATSRGLIVVRLIEKMSFQSFQSFQYNTSSFASSDSFGMISVPSAFVGMTEPHEGRWMELYEFL
jgi:hypothetical protein